MVVEKHLEGNALAGYPGSNASTANDTILQQWRVYKRLDQLF